MEQYPEIQIKIIQILEKENKCARFTFSEFLEKYNQKNDDSKKLTLYILKKVIAELEKNFEAKMLVKKNRINAVTRENIKKLDIRRINSKKRRREPSYQLAFDIINQIAGGENAPSAFKKITDNIKKEFIVKKTGVFQFESSYQQNLVLKEKKFIEIFVEAILENEIINIEYESGDKQPVVPLQIKEYNSRWFLITLNPTNNKVKHFAFDRITEAKNTCKTSEIQKSQRTKVLDSYFKNRIGVSEGTKTEFGEEFDPNKTYNIIFDVERNYFNRYLKNKMWFAAFTFSEEDAEAVGNVKVSVKSKINKELVSKIFYYKSHVQIKEPLFLSAHIHEHIKTLYENYKKNDID